MSWGTSMTGHPAGPRTRAANYTKPQRPHRKPGDEKRMAKAVLKRQRRRQRNLAQVARGGMQLVDCSA